MSRPDIFDLVEEVERQKKAPVNNNRDSDQDIDDLFSMLDEVEKGGFATIDEVRAKVNDINGNDYVNIKQEPISKSLRNKRPLLPRNYGEYDTRFECFKRLIEGVSYEGNSSEYIGGHREALEKYYQDASVNSQNLQLTMGRVNDEINNFGPRNTVYAKGYYDGLFYVLQALTKSKELLMSKITVRLNKALRN